VAVIRYMEDRRLLFGIRSFEDERYCVLSAIDARRFLTEQLGRPDLGKSLTGSLQGMRAAMRRFVEQAGPEAINFRHQHHGPDEFSVALGELRGVVGLHLAALAYHNNIEVEPSLASILPREDDGDPSWLPGFGDDVAGG
jgi:hypothetical protein